MSRPVLYSQSDWPACGHDATGQRYSPLSLGSQAARLPIALRANTGKMRWYFQMTNHGLWDFDAEAAPALIDVVRNGKKAISKISLMFFLDRETGKSIYPAEERPAPRKAVISDNTLPIHFLIE